MRILVTGGTGYIGSHTALTLIECGHEPLLLDNLINSKPAVLDRIATLAGQRPRFVQGDVRDEALLEQTLRAERIDAVIHFAALKAVGESVKQPFDYYDVNVGGSLILLRAMRRVGVRTLVFSSSATVYAADQPMPLREEAALGTNSPYGRTKLMVEEVIVDLAIADPIWSLTSLRYFNPVGAHESGTMGEDPRGVPNNLMPYLAQVAVGRLPRLCIFGQDWPTPDGTCVRDYIHVCDLAAGQVAALDHGYAHPGRHVFNLGTGQGSSVLQVLRAFERTCGKELAFEFAPRRPGDVAANWADASHAERALGWRARRSLDAMCADMWRWQHMNPGGYPDTAPTR
jgi:UDP-glucose 4-epimerase